MKERTQFYKVFPELLIIYHNLLTLNNIWIGWLGAKYMKKHSERAFLFSLHKFCDLLFRPRNIEID